MMTSIETQKTSQLFYFTVHQAFNITNGEPKHTLFTLPSLPHKKTFWSLSVLINMKIPGHGVNSMRN